MKVNVQFPTEVEQALKRQTQRTGLDVSMLSKTSIEVESLK
jgi:hypothetical protein